MDEEKKDISYESFRETAREFSEEHGHDFLTDADAIKEASSSADRESAVSHGEKIRAAREARRFTLAELAAKTGIGQRQLEEMESGEGFLPLGHLIKLSKALSMKMADVISVGDKPFTIVRSGERQVFARFGAAKQASHGYEYESLAPGKKDRMMEPFIVTLQPAAADEPSSHDGQEFIFVLEGEMEVLIDDIREVLKPGDAVYYESASTHLVRAFGDKPAKILAVLTS